MLVQRVTTPRLGPMLGGTPLIRDLFWEKLVHGYNKYKSWYTFGFHTFLGASPSTHRASDDERIREAHLRSHSASISVCE